MSAPIEDVRVTVSCPACGAEGYEVDLDSDDVAKAVQVSMPCDECPARIVVDVDVRVQVEMQETTR